MITQDVITRVRRIFGDEAAVQVTDADVIRWINDGQIEIIKQNDAALQKTNYVDLVLGQAQYSLPADLMILRSLRYKLPDMTSYCNLRYKSMQQFDESIDGWDGTSYTQSHPVFFTMYEDKAILFPVPDGSMVQGLKVLYNQKPTDVANLADALSLPLIYHNTILKYCMWQASLLDEDHEPALMYKTDFHDDMNMLVNNETRDPIATYSTITVLAGDT
jgi:hypothetical protein